MARGKNTISPDLLMNLMLNDICLPAGVSLISISRSACTLFMIAIG
jgi:hypothetical protein